MRQKAQIKLIVVALLLAFGAVSSQVVAQKKLLHNLIFPTPKSIESNIKMTSRYVGLGGVILQDSYLSPLRYGGYSMGYLSESSRLAYSPFRQRAIEQGDAHSRLLSDDTPPHGELLRWMHHSTSAIDYGYTLNPASNASIRRLHLRLDRAVMRRMAEGSWGRLYAGLGATFGVGTLYHSRNGNNPATAQVDAALVARLAYSIQLPWRACPVRMRLSSYTDLIGAAFAPDFGENYYELSESEHGYSQSISLTTINNTLHQRFLVAMDIPIWDRFTLSAAYRWQTHHRTLNHTYSQLSGHTLYFGITSYLRSFKGRKFIFERKHALPF